ncbi:MAG: SdrD B-like domain-containing protein [Acidobacteriota bacterium]
MARRALSPRLSLPASLLCFCASLLCGQALEAQTPVPQGSQILVNSYTTGSQRLPSATTLASGDVVVTWFSFGSSSGDTLATSVLAQRFTSTGEPIGAEFQVNSYTTSYQFSPDVTRLGDDGFIVTWLSDGSDGGDTDITSVQAQRFGADGTALGAQFQVNTATTGNENYPEVAADALGNFAVVWETAQVVTVRRFDSTGAAIGAPFEVEENGSQNRPDIAVAGNGDIVVVWQESFSGVGNEIRGRRFDSLGVGVDGVFDINTVTLNDQEWPAVASAPDGGFVVVWTSDASLPSTEIRGRRFASDGSPLGDDFKVDTSVNGYQRDPAVSIDGDGDFIVVWTGPDDDGGAPPGTSIQGQLFDSTGGRLGDQFTANSLGAQDQRTAAVATANPGDFVVTWTSYGQDNGDTDQSSIEAQRFRVTADLGDFVFLDRDLDGLQGPGDLGLPGIPMHLFGANGDLLDSTLSDADGGFLFQPKIGRSGAVDRFYLQVEPPFRYSLTATDVGPDDAVDSDFDTTFGQTETFEVAVAGADRVGIDAGLANGIGDRVWEDLDGNGLQNGGEPGIDGVTVELYGGADQLLDTTVTANGGRYSFPDLDAGTYYVLFVAPDGLAFTREQAGEDTADSDASPASGATPLFFLSIGDIQPQWDAGLEPAVIGDRVWLDDNADGRQQPGEGGLAGVLVRLLDAADAEVASTVTDADGLYRFAEVPTGTYRVEVQRLGSGVFSPKGVGENDLLDSDVDPADGRTDLFDYVAGSARRTYDAGIRTVPLFADGFESGDASAWSALVVQD